jgi:hypothetical protein
LVRILHFPVRIAIPVPNALGPLKNAPFCPTLASGSNFNPQNPKCIPVVKIFAFLGLEQNGTFFKGLPL